MNKNGAMPYLGRMTIQTQTHDRPPLVVGIRHRLTIAREEAYPDMPIAEFSARILGVGKNTAGQYESRNGTREENMKDMVLRRWAEVCNVRFESLKYGIGVQNDGPTEPGILIQETDKKITFRSLASLAEKRDEKSSRYAA